MDPGVRELALVSIHSGHSVEDVQAATGFPLRLSPDLAQTPSPTREELELIRQEVDPLGMRRLEFVAGKERGPLLAALIDSEEAAIADFQMSREVSRAPEGS
jgi:glutaconate CoA-transferase, subunit A